MSKQELLTELRAEMAELDERRLFLAEVIIDLVFEVHWENENSDI